MPNPTSRNPLDHVRISDVRGLAQLATRATLGVTRITEEVHQAVHGTLGIAGGAEPGQTGGVTGLVYRSIHQITGLVGQSVDTALATLQHFIEVPADSRPGAPQREAAIAALNGVMGDRLLARNNPLAIPMTLRYQGEALDWNPPPSTPQVTNKVLLLVHGLCMTDLQWQERHRLSPPHGETSDHGEVLASELGYTPVYLRYNSGLHTSQNGRELSAQLEALAASWPVPIEEVTVLAHSLGGLVMRSALHYAQEENRRWPDNLKRIVFLGTPHHGAPLERIGNWVDAILGSTPHTSPFARLGQLRSAGITDLRYGNVLDDDWEGKDRFRRRPDGRRIVPLPESLACYAVAATKADRGGSLSNRLIGDGLVPVDSALGDHDETRRSLALAKSSRWIGYRMNHMELLSSPLVGRQLLRWLEPARS